MRRITMIIWSIVWVVTAHVQAQERHAFSDRLYIPLQFAGNMGLVSGGIGYRTLKDNYQLSIVYGYAPKSVSVVPVHLITAKNIFHFHRFTLSDHRSVIPYGAIGVSLEVGGHSFFTQPDFMQESYYDFPKSLRAIPALGAKLRHQSFKFRHFTATEFFAEASTVDVFIWYMLRSDRVRPDNIVSVSFGVHFLL